MKRKSSQTDIANLVQVHDKYYKHCDQDEDTTNTKTELIQEIRKLKALNDQLRKALDSVSTSVCITEEDGNVIFMNKTCKDLLTPIDSEHHFHEGTHKDGTDENHLHTTENNGIHSSSESILNHARADFSPMSISELTNQTPPQPSTRLFNSNENHVSDAKPQIGDNFFVALGNNSNANELCCIPKPLKATITRTDPLTKKEQQYSLVCEAHENLEGEHYLVNTVTEANTQQKMACEIYKDIVEHFSVGISVWCFEDTLNEPSFRLVGMNKQAREKLNSPQVEIGLSLGEILREQNAQQVASTFSSVLNTNKEISLDQFTLDGKTQFSVKVTPFKFKCVGVMFGSAKASKPRERDKHKEKEDIMPQSLIPPMNYSIHSEELFKQAFEYDSFGLAIFKRADVGNRIDFQFMISNAAARSFRKQNFSLLNSGKMYLSDAFPSLQDQKFMQQIVSAQIGKPLTYVINDWMNDNYAGGVYFGKFTRLPNDALLSCVMPLNAHVLRQYTAAWNFCCQKEYVKEDLKDIHIFSSTLENITKSTLPPVPAIAAPLTTHPPFSSQHSASIPLQSYPILPPLSPPSHFHHAHEHEVDFLHSNSNFTSPIHDIRTTTPPPRANPVIPQVQAPAQQIIPSVNSLASNANIYQQHQLLLQVLREQQVRQQLLLQQIQLQAEKQQLERDKLEQDKAAFEKELESHRKSLPFLINSINSQGQPDVGLEAYKVAFHDAPVGLSLVSTHGTVLAANNKFAAMLGYTSDDIVNNTFVPITHPEDVDSSVDVFKQMLTGKANGAHVLKRYVHKAGHAVWCLLSTTLARDASGNPLVFISSIQLLDSLKTILSGAEVKRDEELYRQIFNKSNVGMSLLGKDGCVQNVNNTFLDRMHWHSSEVIGKPYFNFFIKEDQENIKNLIQTMAEGRLLRHQTLARIEEASGDAFWCLLNLYCLTDANGVVTHVLAKFQDVEPLQKLFSQHTFPKPKGRRQMQFQQQ